MSQEALLYAKGLPANLDAERFVLGSILLNNECFLQVATVLSADDFSLEKHRRIFGRMLEISNRAEYVDRVTVANELMKQGQLESVDGLGYLVSLDDGLPEITNLESYVRIVADAATRRRLIFAHQAEIEKLIRGEDEIAELIDSSERAISNIRSTRRLETNFMDPDKILGAAGGIENFISPKFLPSIASPWAKLNDMLRAGGFEPQQLVIIGGRPATGKTAAATNIAVEAVRLGYRVFYVGLEMGSAAMLRRMISSESHVNLKKLRYVEADKDERDAICRGVSLLQGDSYPLMNIWNSASATVMSLRAELRRTAVAGPIGMVVIDYLQLMSSVMSRKSDNRNQEISEISRGLKLLGMELKCPIIALSQLSRDSVKTNRKPELSDLRDSGSLEQDADIVMFTHSDFVSDTLAPDIDCELIIRKQREGPTGAIPMTFVRRFTRFEERAA